MPPPKGAQRATVFISSLNRYELAPGRTLSNIRQDLVRKIEQRYPFLSVDINEDWPARGASNPRRTTEHLARSCHLFIGVLVDDDGYNDVDGYSATQIEFDAALADSADKMLVFLWNKLRDAQVTEELPLPYRRLLDELRDYRKGKIVTWFDGEADLETGVLDAIGHFCAQSLKTMRLFPAYASDKSRIEAQWELMTFTERHREMMSVFRREAESIKLESPRVLGLEPVEREPEGPDPAVERYRLEIRPREETITLPVLFSACPDRFSYADAARYVGYPFRTAVEGWKEEVGPLHVIAIARTITDTQVRRHLGNPDIHVFQESWGFFAADPERLIQAVYLTRCLSPQALVRQVRRFLAWLDLYEQLDALVQRAKTRGAILRARPHSV